MNTKNNLAILEDYYYACGKKNNLILDFNTIKVLRSHVIKFSLNGFDFPSPVHKGLQSNWPNCDTSIQNIYRVHVPLSNIYSIAFY